MLLAASLDAVRAFLKSKFSTTRIYVNTVPPGFKRPSFFVGLATNTSDDLNKAMYESTPTWQIVYFAPTDGEGNPDALNQYSISDIIITGLREAMALASPEIKNEAGEVVQPVVVWHINEVEGGPRDAEVYITVQLEAEFTRPSETYDLMQEINYIQNK